VVGGQHHAPTALPPGKEPVPIVQEAGWEPGPLSTGTEYPPGFYSRNVEPLASRCTDYAISAHVTIVMYRKLFWKMRRASEVSLADSGPRVARQWRMI
jgi:hypothetical protein